MAFVTDNLTAPPEHTFILFSDGSHNPEKGAGAAAVEYIAAVPDDSRTLNVQVGTQTTQPPTKPS